MQLTWAAVALSPAESVTQQAFNAEWSCEEPPAHGELIQSSPPACFNTGSFNAALTTFGEYF